MNSRRKLIIVGQTPPPYNGQAKMIRQMIDGLRDEFDLLHIRMGYSDSVVSAGKFRMSKITHLFHLIRETRRALQQHPGAVLYYPPASPNWIPVLRDIIYLLAVRPLAAKTVLHFHSGGVSEFVLQHRWLKRPACKAYGKADVAIELGRSCPHDGKFFEARRVVVVPNGINIPVSARNRQSAIGNLKILHVGIHTESKGLFDLLETAKELKRRGVSFEIRTAGLWYTDRERDRFNRMRKEYGLEAEVLTTGQKTGAELWSLYSWADVFFFPTFYPWETFGIVQLEAMAYGLPVVASDWQGPKDVVLNGETGFLCPARDTKGFADALQRLAQDGAMRAQMGRAGLEHYRRHFTADCFVRNMKQVFDEVLT
ncbi:MAG: glycosyltransferase family 4 protein [Kiritimatiellaceae bacterium]|nr:glycosyltransferase family 4 protein [Kiritimatiellaceae bacterium]